jgi:hypothetical protein
VTSQVRVGDELDWLAVDCVGHVGLFSTAGFGPVPKAVTDHLADVSAGIARLGTLPVTGDSDATASGDLTFWTVPAARGVYAFDWGSSSSGPYTRIITPHVPLFIGEVADMVVSKAAGIVQLAVDFSEVIYLDADAVLSQREA